MRTNRRIAVFLFLLLNVFFLSAQTPFSRGVNLTNWFQAGSAKEIQFTKYTKEDFMRIKGLGCDVIRLPINLHFMTSGAPDFTLDPLFLDLLDQTVDWAEELQVYLMLDNHTFDPNANTTPEVEGILLKIWPQMAEHFKDRSNYLLYEVLNEPHGITNTLWCNIQGNVINAIRAIDTKHTIVVGPADYNSYRVPFTSIKNQTTAGPFNASIFPNPMKESATLQYDLPEAGYVNVGIYNMAGHRLATIVDQRENQGRHQVLIDRGQPGLARLTDGVYVCKITSSGKSFTVKLVVKH